MKSFVAYSPESHFPIENIPWGVIALADGSQHIATRIGDMVLDVHAAILAGLLFSDAASQTIRSALLKPVLNDFMALGKTAWHTARAAVQALLLTGSPLEKHPELLLPAAQTRNVMPATIGDYTDFYASEEHATNVGKMFRDPTNPLLPNWKHIPIGYHGRSSSIVISGTDLHRPNGQLNPEEKLPILAPSKLVDFELEVAAFVGPGNPLGSPISIKDARDHIFGLVVMNDWSARDIQRWEYVPLGPFGGKNWGTTISPWIVTMEALEPFRTHGKPHDVPVLPYLEESKDRSAIDIQLFVHLQAADIPEPAQIVHSNLKYLYWSFEQQLTHHAIVGCNMRPGDLLGSGTISGAEISSFGSMLELSWKGSREIQLPGGATRKFLKDNDTVIMSGYCQGAGFRVGFGEAIGKILPAVPIAN